MKWFTWRFGWDAPTAGFATYFRAPQAKRLGVKNMNAHRFPTLVIAAVLLLPSAVLAGAENSFEALMQKFPQCQLSGVYLDTKTNQVAHPYFRENRLTPYKIEKGFAYYSLNTSYFGIPVVEFMIPASTWSLHVVKFNMSLGEAQMHLMRVLGSDFQPSEKSANRERPELIADPKNPSHSFFICDDPT